MVGSSKSVRPVKGGRRERMQCPECAVITTFRECVAIEKLTAFMVLDLIEDEETVFRCDECGEAFSLEEKPDELEDLSSSTSHDEQRAAQQAEARRLDAEQRERECRERERRVDDELAALKLQLGMREPGTTNARPVGGALSDDAPERRRWWQPWRRTSR